MIMKQLMSTLLALEDCEFEFRLGHKLGSLWLHSKFIKMSDSGGRKGEDKGHISPPEILKKNKKQK